MRRFMPCRINNIANGAVAVVLLADCRQEQGPGPEGGGMQGIWL